MGRFKSIVCEDIPCWYELSWRKEIEAIVLRIHKDFIKSINSDFQKVWFIEELIKKFQFNEFNCDFKENIGFDKVFENIGEKDGFVEFSVDIPIVRKKTDKKCSFCSGSGKDDFYKIDCRSCKGTGKESILDWKKVYTISASFTALTKLFQIFDGDTSSSFSQLITLHTITERDMHGGSLGGEISIALKKWLNYFKEHTEISEMAQAMAVTYSKMFGYDSYYDNSFWAVVREGGKFTADCPGDACGIHPMDWCDENRGYKFTCHNVDNPMQQITLIAGLAALNNKARKEMK